MKMACHFVISAVWAGTLFYPRLWQLCSCWRLLADDCNVTSWWLPYEFLRLPDDCQMTVWWLHDDCLMTSLWLSVDCLMPLWWVMTASWLLDDFLMTTWWLPHAFMMTASWLPDDCLRLLRLPAAVKSLKRWRSRRGQRAWHTDPDICKWIVLSIMIMLITRSSIWLWWWDIIAYFYRHGRDVWLLGKHIIMSARVFRSACKDHFE